MEKEKKKARTWCHVLYMEMRTIEACIYAQSVSLNGSKTEVKLHDNIMYIITEENEITIIKLI